MKSYEKFAGALSVNVVLTDDPAIARHALKFGYIETGDVNVSESEPSEVPQPIEVTPPKTRKTSVKKKAVAKA